ncbi:MAG TPA: ATP-binding protein [Gemmatimonadaceae bacterium]|nr:ATP-binding protein [Gemmatimonadaceae bacterium]
MPSTRPNRSLETELLIKLAVLLAAAVVLPLALLSARRLPAVRDPFVLAFVVAIDVILFVAWAGLVLRHAVIRPLRNLAKAAEEIVAGDLARRMPPTTVVELHDVSSKFDQLTARAMEDQAQLVRVEKLASIGRLAASVAHEIGNPLGAILGQVHQLRARLRQRADSLEMLGALERESARIERIVRGLLDYARARPPALVPVAIDDVVRSSVALLRSQGLFAAVDVTLELTDEALFVSSDRHDLEQLFVNLLINAVDAMSGRGCIVVRLERAARFTLREPAMRRTADARADAIEHPPSLRAQRWLGTHDAIEIAKIIVADSGPGVPRELAERIFDPFFTTKPSGKGTGLGLAIVSRIVDNFQGTIWVTTAREGGAAFHVLFPSVALPADAKAPATGNRRRPTPPVGWARKARR